MILESCPSICLNMSGHYCNGLSKNIESILFIFLSFIFCSFRWISMVMILGILTLVWFTERKVPLGTSNFKSMGCFACDRNFLSTVRSGCETCGQVVKFCCWSLVLVLTSFSFFSSCMYQCRVCYYVWMQKMLWNLKVMSITNDKKERLSSINEWVC